MMVSQTLKIRLPSGLSFDLIYVEGGDFMMGDEVGDLWEACYPIHPVQISSFYIGKFAVTQELWQVIMDSNPSRIRGGNLPVQVVSWDDAQDFIRRINRICMTTSIEKEGFRLPTEAEWEYAARGGRNSQLNFGDVTEFNYAGSDRLNQVGWYKQNTNQTREVGLLIPNELGIHDMSGNVWEWCSDWFDLRFYQKCIEIGTVLNPSGAEMGFDRVIRGGSFRNSAQNCRLSYRHRYRPDTYHGHIGFRLVYNIQ